jgi:neopullulanase
MANYMIQNSIWWIEYAGLQGIRQDTYPYPDKEAMRQWNLRVRQEYPYFNIVGESWISSPSKLAYWQKDFPNHDGYNSELPSIFDFPLMEALRRGLNEKESWDDGLMRLYDILADDHLYPNPNNLVTFAENHDIGRLMFFLNEDVRKFKMAMAFLATTRGTPQLYYGTEILMSGNGFDGHSHIREDFPGGWPGDKTNAFTAIGRTAAQNEAWNYMSMVFNYRKNNPVLHNGRLLHYIPMDEIYVYFRLLGDKGVMVVLNNSDDKAKTINTKRFAEALEGFTKGKDIETGKTIDDLTNIDVPAKSALIIELDK